MQPSRPLSEERSMEKTYPPSSESFSQCSISSSKELDSVSEVSKPGKLCPPLQRHLGEKVAHYGGLLEPDTKKMRLSSSPYEVMSESSSLSRERRDFGELLEPDMKKMRLSSSSVKDHPRHGSSRNALELSLIGSSFISFNDKVTKWLYIPLTSHPAESDISLSTGSESHHDSRIQIQTGDQDQLGSDSGSSGETGSAEYWVDSGTSAGSDISEETASAEYYMEEQDEVKVIHVAVEHESLEVEKHLSSLFLRASAIEDQDGNKPVLADLAMELGNEEIVSPEDVLEQEIVAVRSPEDVTEQDTGRLQRMRSSVVIKFVRNFRLKNIRLMHAAKSGKYTTAEKLLKNGTDPNTKEVDYLLWTPLMWASYNGHTETVKVLLKYRAKPNTRATNGYTALILASGRGHHKVVATLVDPTNPIKADLNIRNSVRGWSALMWASQTGRLSRQSASEEAKENRRKVVKHLLAAGADVNLKTRNGWTPLMQASQDGDAELVKILCEAEGVDLDHGSESTWTALTTACRKKREDIVMVLVEHGAKVDKKKKGGVTAMHIASYYNLREATRSLVEVGGGDVNIQDEWGMTALILAAKQKHHDLISYLVLEAKAKVNIQAERYAAWSALFFAVKNGDKKIVDFLLENGADPYLLDKHQHNSLTYSKGLFLGKKVKIYKHLVNKLFPEGKPEDTTPIPQEGATWTPQEGATPAQSRESVDRQDFTPANAAVYTSTDLMWRTVQLPNLIFN